MSTDFYNAALSIAEVLSMKFNERFLNEVRSDFLTRLGKVQIQVESEWFSGVIESRTVNGEEVSVVATFPQFNEREVYIESSRVVDGSGNEVAVQDERYNKIKGHGLMINITVPIKEVIEDVQQNTLARQSR